MQVSFHHIRQRLRVPVGRPRLSLDGLALAERLLLAIVAIQIVRLVWTLVSPVGSFGPWEARVAQFPNAVTRQALFSSFDPFYRSGAQQAEGSGVVTSLALTLYGVRLNEGSGLGSAIIASPDGVQNSFAVGDEIMPGVVLKAVAFDHVIIDRSGAEEQVFMDQSAASSAAEPGDAALQPGSPSAAPPIAPGGATVDTLRSDVGFVPRLENGRVTGLAVQSKGPGFASFGFRPGDIVTQLNGQPVGDLQSVQSRIVPGARLSLSIERGASTVPVNIILQGQ